MPGILFSQGYVIALHPLLCSAPVARRLAPCLIQAFAHVIFSALSSLAIYLKLTPLIDLMAQVAEQFVWKPGPVAESSLVLGPTKN